MSASRVAGVVLVAGLTVAGCGSQHQAGTVPARVGAATSRTVARSVGGGTAAWTSCHKELGSRWPVGFTTDTLTLTPLSHAFHPTSVIVCDEQTETRADGGQELVATEQRSTDTTALEAALRLPDEPATSGSCASDLQTVPWFAVLDSRGRWVRPGVPYDECHQPRVEVLNALRALPLKTVSTVPVRLLESGAAVQSGCDMQWSDMVHVEAGSDGDARSVATGADPFAGISRLRVCLYTVPGSELGGIKPAGTFTAGGVLSGAPRHKLGSLLTELPAAAPCTQEATRFAVITRIETGYDPTGYLELDGCQRLLVETSVTSGSLTREISALSQASAALVSYIGEFHPS